MNMFINFFVNIELVIERESLIFVHERRLLEVLQNIKNDSLHLPFLVNATLRIKKY